MSALTHLAADIRREHEAAQACATKAVEHAKRAGELLIEAKAALPHGEWLPWLAKNFSASQSQAFRYMKIAANYARVNSLPDSERPTSIRQALNLLAEPTESAIEHDDEGRGETIDLLLEAAAGCGEAVQDFERSAPPKDFASTTVDETRAFIRSVDSWLAGYAAAKRRLCSAVISVLHHPDAAVLLGEQARAESLRDMHASRANWAAAEATYLEAGT